MLRYYTMEFSQWLQNQLHEKNLKKSQLSYYSKVSDAEISRLVSGKRTPSAKTLRKLAQALKVSEAEIFQAAGYLSPDAPKQNTVRIALLGSVHVNGVEMVADPSEYIEINRSVVDDDTAFALTVRDNHLASAGINQGDLLFVSRRVSVSDGDIAVVNLNDKLDLKKFYLSDDRIVLHSLDDTDKAPIVIGAAQQHDVILGKVIGSYRKF